MAFEEKRLNILGFFRLIMVCGALAAIFLFVFFNPDYSRYFYVLVSVIGLYLTVFYVLTDRREPAPKAPALKKFPSLTVLVPSYNGGPTLKNCLNAILKMKYPLKFNVVIVDDCSTDNTSEIAKSFPTVKILRNPSNIGKAKGLNKAILKLKTELVVCIDSDTYPNPNVLLDCVPMLYSKPNVGAVAPFITVANAKSFVQRMQEIEYYSGFGFYSKVAAKMDGLYVAPGPLTVFKRSALLKIKGFDEDNLTEDMEIALRLRDHGYSISYAPSKVPTEVPSTWIGLYNQRLRWYRGTIFNILKYKKMFFNPEFSAFGRFFFPALTVFVSTILLSFVVIWGLIFFGIYNFFMKLYFSAVSGHFLLLNLTLENLTVHSLWVFIVVAIVVWYVFFVESISMLGVRRSRQMILPALSAVFLYPLIISLVYTISLIKELKASKRSW